MTLQFREIAFGWTALAAAVAWVLFVRQVRRRRFVASTAFPMLHGRRAYRASTVRRLVGATLWGAAGCVAVAAMEPVLPNAESQLQSRGVDIVMVLDLSSSMTEPMKQATVAVQFDERGQPKTVTRLDTVKRAIRAFVAKRTSDRMGLVGFGESAYLVSPLTFDRDYFGQYVTMVDEHLLQGATAIGEGIGLATQLLLKQSQAHGAGSRAIIVFTDGENNAGRDPGEAIMQASNANIHTYVVGLAEQRAPVDPFFRQQMEEQYNRMLTALTETGGRYFSATSVEDLALVSARIDQLEKSVLTSKVYMRDVPVFHWFLIGSIVLVLLSLLLRAVPFFVDLT